MTAGKGSRFIYTRSCPLQAPLKSLCSPQHRKIPNVSDPVLMVPHGAHSRPFLSRYWFNAIEAIIRTPFRSAMLISVFNQLLHCLRRRPVPKPALIEVLSRRSVFYSTRFISPAPGQLASFPLLE